MGRIKSKHYLTFDFLILSLVSLGFFCLIIFDVNSWYYSAIGDEYAFFTFARDVATQKVPLSILPANNTVNIFSQNVVYNYISTASLMFQSAVMKIFGINHFGWVTSSVLIVIFSVWFFYFLIKDSFERETAIFSSLILISSHYLWAFTHTGYWHMQAFFPPLASFFFFFRGLKHKKNSLLFLSGLFSALGFYTHFLSRLTIILLMLFFVFNLKRLFLQKKILLSFTMGFLILFIPFILINQQSTIQPMLERSVVASKEIPDNQRLLYFWENLYKSFFAFYRNSQTGIFVSGSLVDPITISLFSLGFMLMIFFWKKYFFILLCYLVCLIAIGAFSPYPHPPIARLFFLLPIVALISGFALSAISRFFKDFYFLRLSLLTTLLSLIFALNLYRFYYETPRKMDLTPEALVIKAISSFAPCNSNTIVVFPHFEPLLKPALSSYNMSQSISFMQTLTKSDRQYVEDKSCIIFVEPKEATSLQAMQEFTTNGKFLRKDFSSPSKNRNIVVFFKPL